MCSERRSEILRRLNAFDSGTTEADRSFEREAEIRIAVETEGALKWGRLSSGIAGGMFGRSAEPR